MDNFIGQILLLPAPSNSAWKYPSIEATVKFVTSFILPCLNYYNFILSGLLLPAFLASRSVLLTSY